VRNCEKAEAVLAQAFSSSGGNHQEEVAEGHVSRFPRLRQFPQASPSERFFLFGSFSFFVQIRLPARNNSRHDRL
jgi:hypothetical protein